MTRVEDNKIILYIHLKVLVISVIGAFIVYKEGGTIILFSIACTITVQFEKRFYENIFKRRTLCPPTHLYSIARCGRCTRTINVNRTAPVI